MLRCCRLFRAPPKVLCLTTIPGGGAMTSALERLGYRPYTFQHTFTGGRVCTHPQEWCMVLDKQKPFNFAILNNTASKSAVDFGGFDALVGPPCTYAFEAILKECPLSTRVILMEGLDKEFLKDADNIWGPLLRQTERAARRQAGAHLHKMVVKMSIGIAGDNQKKFMADVLETLEERVKAVVPKDRLLVYRYGSGWEPLCTFLGKPVPYLDDGDIAPFPSYDNGAEVAADLSYRLQRVERVVICITYFLFAALIVLYTPLYTQLRHIVSAYYKDYCEAFEPLLHENEGKRITLREALVLAKKTTMSFEEKWRERGGAIGAAGEALSKLGGETVE